jgi:hypothetical protein
MTETIEVEIDEAGTIHPKEPTTQLPPGRAFLTWQKKPDLETMLLSEAALAKNWLSPEEDAAWAHLQPVK